MTIKATTGLADCRRAEQDPGDQHDGQVRDDEGPDRDPDPTNDPDHRQPPTTVVRRASTDGHGGSRARGPLRPRSLSGPGVMPAYDAVVIDAMPAGVPAGRLPRRHAPRGGAPAGDRARHDARGDRARAARLAAHRLRPAGRAETAVLPVDLGPERARPPRLPARGADGRPGAAARGPGRDQARPLADVHAGRRDRPGLDRAAHPRVRPDRGHVTRGAHAPRDGARGRRPADVPGGGARAASPTSGDRRRHACGRDSARAARHRCARRAVSATRAARVSGRFAETIHHRIIRRVDGATRSHASRAGGFASKRRREVVGDGQVLDGVEGRPRAALLRVVDGASPAGASGRPP